MSGQPRVVVDVWGGPDAPPSCWRARWMRPLDEALAFARLEVLTGHVVNVFLQPAPVEEMEHDEFDYRVQGRA